MDVGSIVVNAGFMILAAICIVAVKKLWAVSFLAACGIGIPAAFVIGMATVWLLAKLSGPKRP